VGALAAVGVLRVRILNGLDRRFFREPMMLGRSCWLWPIACGRQRARGLVSTFREEIGRALHPDGQVFLRRTTRPTLDDGPERPTPVWSKSAPRAEGPSVGSALRRDMARITARSRVSSSGRSRGSRPLRTARDPGRHPVARSKRSGEPFGREDLDLVRAAATSWRRHREPAAGGEIRAEETEERLRREIELPGGSGRLLPTARRRAGLDIAGTCKPLASSAGLF